MAYSCVEVWFEIGHDASIRTKRTPEGFTHDWEVFVRGVDNSDIHFFVEKVVFHLHETFQKPKRVIKEPPYSLKESGYAGFNLPIEVYFKNKDEPKKVKYHYDLHLQSSGLPISRMKREKYTFSNPSEDFRRKLIDGGGVGVLGSEAGGNSVSSEKTCAEEGISSVQPTVKHSTPPLAGKPKLTRDPVKKTKIKDTKIEDTKASNSFADLFGTPIKTAKVSPDPKKTQVKVSPASKNSRPLDKTDKLNAEKQYSGVKPKHIPQKEIKKEKESSSKDDKRERKDKGKEREHSKEKISSAKHSVSPPKLTKEESKKSACGEHKEKMEAKNCDPKSERKKDKKAKEEKVKKEKHNKEGEKVASDKCEKHVRENKDRDQKKSPKLVNKEVEKVREKEKHRDSEKDRLKHKHKKREKEKYKKVKDESKKKEKVKEKSKVEEKENSNVLEDHRGEKRKRSESHSLSPSPQHSPVLPISPEKEVERQTTTLSKEKPSKHPLSTLFAELEDHDSSDSNSSPLSGEEDVIEIPKAKGKVFSTNEIKLEQVKDSMRVDDKLENPHSDNVDDPNQIEEVKIGKHKQSSHRDKGSSLSNSCKSKSKDKSLRKKEKECGELNVENAKEVDRKRKKRSKREKEEVLLIEEPQIKEIKQECEAEGKDEINDFVLRPPMNSSSNYKPKFSKEYLIELLDLQKKIMTLKDDAELQKVVKVLAQSGKYEINNKTFDVDLCALDKNTVKKLQEFFSVS